MEGMWREKGRETQVWGKGPLGKIKFVEVLLCKFKYPLLLPHSRLLSEIAICSGLDPEEAE